MKQLEQGLFLGTLVRLWETGVVFRNARSSVGNGVVFRDARSSVGNWGCF